MTIDEISAVLRVKAEWARLKAILRDVKITCANGDDAVEQMDQAVNDLETSDE